MRLDAYRLGMAVVLTLGFLGILTTVSDAETPAYEPVSNVKTIMNAMNHEEEGFFGMIKAFSATEPGRGDKAWGIMGHRALMIAESGNVLAHMSPPKGDVESWKTKAAAFRDAAKALSKACKFRKADKLAEEMIAVRKACDACHDAHRPE
jgi:hypothetical protein